MRGNAVPIGVVSIATLVSELGRVDWTGVPRVLVLHQLMGFCPELLIDLAKVFSPDKAIACIHDFFTLCPSWAMLRNNVAFCGGPPPDSQACSICAYGGGEREQHLERLAGLFATLKPHILAPSETALQFWLGHSSFEYATARVIPHGKLIMEPTLRPKKTEVHLRVGFAGGAAFHKGWHVFEELASRHSNDSRYSFFHFGGERAGRARDVTFVKVTVQPDQRQAMIDSLIANEIDVVVNWSLCYETFCYAAYEAVAAGAFVLAPNKAGNIVPAVSQQGIEQGLGLDTEEQLFELFDTGEIFELVSRRRFGELHVQSGTALCLEGLD